MRLSAILGFAALAVLASCNREPQPGILLGPNSVPLNFEKSYYLSLQPKIDFPSSRKHEQKVPSPELPPELSFIVDAMKPQPANKEGMAAGILNFANDTMLFFLIEEGIKHTGYKKTFSSEMSEDEVVALVRSHYSKSNTTLIEWERGSTYYPRPNSMVDGGSGYEFEVPSQKLLVVIQSRANYVKGQADKAWTISAAKLE